MRSFNALSFALGFFIAQQASGQCQQVLHTEGDQIVGGSAVTVTSSGVVDVNSTYCTETLPYFIGYNTLTGSGDGSYSFHFDPPVDSLTLNFSGISQMPNGTEIVSLWVNGAHYAIPTQGNVQFCDPWAVLTPEGDITGCVECPVSGWKGTGVAGPISDLMVRDSITVGEAAGSIFSLFVCASTTGVNDHALAGQRMPYPNPAAGAFQVDALGARYVTVDVYDLRGLAVQHTHTNQSQRLSISTAGLHAGLYTVMVQRDDVRSTYPLFIE